MFQNVRFDFRLISLYFYLILIEILAVQALKNYGQSCNESNVSVNNVSEMCDPMFICHQYRCKCRVGYGYDSTISEKCIKFDDFLCEEDVDCNGVDRNRWCNQMTNKCECNRMNGFYETRDNRICKSRHSSINQSCYSDNDCTIDYSYCKNSICKCWPEFALQIDQIRVSADKTIATNHCVRKICSDNTNCQTPDNPNLICNNTICECEYGYNLDSHRLCVKISRRQNCNITCQIIGGLFASIFMLSLIYWCFYCCYSIVKNYKMHNRNRNCINNNHIIEDSPQHRFNRRQSSMATHMHRNEQTLPINTSEERYFIYDNETPPTYSQISDEPPDYETVVHMKAND